MPPLREKKEADPIDAPSDQGILGLLPIAWNRKLLVILGIVAGLLVGWMYFLQRVTVYESTAQIKLEKTFPSGPVQGIDGITNMGEDYLATQMEILKSPRIIRAAVKRGDFDKLASFAGQEDVSIASTIPGALTVKRVVSQGSSSPTCLVNVSYRSKDREDCRTVLEQLLISYENYLKDDHRKSNTKTFEELLQMHSALENDWTVKQDKLRALRASSQAVRTKGGGALRLENLTNIQAKRTHLAMRRAETGVRLDTLKAVIDKGEDATPFLDLTPEIGKVLAEGEEASLDDLLTPLLVRERQLSVQFGPAHPDVRAVREQVAATREVWELRHPGSASRQRNPKERSASKEAVDAYVRLLKAQLIDFELSEQALVKLAESEAAKVFEQGGIHEEEETLRKDIEDKRELARSYRKRMDEVTLAKERGGIVAEISAEPVQGYQVEPKLTPILLVSLLGGLLGGVGLAWLAEVTDRSFRNPNDLQRRLKFPILGYVPHLTLTKEEKQKAKQGLLPLDPSIRVFYSPNSTEAEAFRGLRTVLISKLETAGHKVVQITSPRTGDGKLTLATNLAVAIAQVGKRTLLIDADFRRSRLQRMFGLHGTAGLASVLAGEATLQESLHPCAVPNLFVLPSGPRPRNPAELLSSQRFLEVLDLLREQYDVILIHTPPLLVVSDASVIAPRADGLLLTLRVVTNGRPAAECARDILANLGANVYGVIVNGLVQGSVGSSHYNYAHRYHYEGADDRCYYHDVDPAASVNGAPGLAPRAGLWEPIRWLLRTLWH